MIKFFRTIRQHLLMENPPDQSSRAGKTGKPARTLKAGRYLKYAIGEIILVVIGILIALSINNWNEGRKDRLKERAYLEGIRDDLTGDIRYIDFIIPFNEKRKDNYARVDSLVQVRSDELFDIEFSEISDLSRQTSTFYPRVGSYSSLLAENSAGLIRNKELLRKLKTIYEIQYLRVSLLGQELDDISTQIHWERRLDFRNQLSGYTFEDYNALFADLAVLDWNIHKFNNRMIGLKEQITNCIADIDLELEKP